MMRLRIITPRAHVEDCLVRGYVELLPSGLTRIPTDERLERIPPKDVAEARRCMEVQQIRLKHGSDVNFKCVSDLGLTKQTVKGDPYTSFWAYVSDYEIEEPSGAKQ